MANLKKRIRTEMKQLRPHRESSSNRPERRVGYPPIPAGIELILNDAQAACLSDPMQKEWSLAFVRSEGLVEPIIVVVDDSTNEYAILAEDGLIYYDSRLKYRTYGLLAAT